MVLTATTDVFHASSKGCGLAAGGPLRPKFQVQHSEPERRRMLQWTDEASISLAKNTELARRLKIDIYFCDLHAPWQRRSNENTNGLLRQFILKGTDLDDASQTWLNDVAVLLNNRPRNTLGWRIPAEAMADEIEAFKSTVALEVAI